MKSESITEKYIYNTQKLDELLEKNFNLILKVRMNQFENEGVDKIIVPELFEISISESNYGFLFKNGIFQVPSFGKLLCLIFLSFKFSDKIENGLIIREIDMSSINRKFDYSYHSYISLVSKIIYAIDKMENNLPVGSTKTSYLFLYKEENNDVHSKVLDTDDIIMAYKNAGTELNINIDFDSEESKKFYEFTKDFINEQYLNAKQSIS